MTKKLLCRSCAWILAALLTATGCSIPKIRRIGDRPPAEPELPPETEALPETEPVPETEPAPEPEPEPVIPENVRVLSEEDFEAPVGEGLWEISCLPFTPNAVSNLSQGMLIACGPSEDLMTMHIALLDLENRTVTEGSYAYPEGEEVYYRSASLYLLEDTPVFYDTDSNLLVIYDRFLQEVNRTESFDALCYGVVRLGGRDLGLMSDDRQMRVCTVGEDGSFSLTDWPLDAPEEFDTINFCGSIDDDYFLVNCYDEDTWDFCYGTYERETGKVTPFSQGYYNVVNVAGGVLVSDYNSDEASFYQSGQSSRIVFRIPETYYLGDSSPEDRFVYMDKVDEEGVSILRYDPISGLCAGQVETDGEFRYTSRFAEWGDDVYFTQEDGMGYRICRWKPEAASPAPGFDILTAGSALSDENRALIDALYEEYGVTVYTGNDAVRYMDSYAVLPETGENKIHETLVLLSDFFAHTPEGFLREVVSCYSSLDICLTGRIIPEIGNRDSISDATAFTTTVDDLELAVFDINQGGMEKTIAHEFMHIFENAAYRVEVSAWERGETTDCEVFDRWNMLNPEDFEYRYVYTDEDGNTYNWDDNGMNGQFWTEEQSPDEIYFVDGYSMTYPTEDKARIFENLATSWKYELPGYFAGKSMQLKAAYLCACLRDTFSSLRDGTECFWEQGVNTEEYDLTYFREHYDYEAWAEEHAMG